jgi:tRNA A-37 threonylcarbamoyl transferase component Bud32
MTAAQRQRVRELFEAAIDRPPSDGRPWMQSQAADDPDVLAEVLSLFDHHQQAGSFLRTPIGDRLADLFDDDVRFEPGAVIGSYTVTREIGRGGFSRVYLATDARLKREVAVKALRPSLTRDPVQRERLRREAQAAAGLTHPGICTIYAFEEIDDEVFIISEYIEGQSLRDDIKGGRRPSVATVIESGRELAEALASAHAKGITHRDLKPENVMRTRDGHLKILDFGLALVNGSAGGREAQPRMTVDGTVVGTPGYMAPEQLKGGTIDSRTDIFSLGVLMYEYASGVHPFDGETDMERMARVLESEPRAIRELRPDLPELAAFAISRCLRKKPAERFSAVSDIVPTLLAGDDPALSTRAIGWWRKHQVIVLAMYLLASASAWRIKEWQHGVADTAFVAIAVMSTMVGIFRGHLLFTEWMHPSEFRAELRRARTVTFAVDLVIAAVVGAIGAQLASIRPLAGTLSIALAIGIAFARLVIEPTTTRAAFDPRRGMLATEP